MSSRGEARSNFVSDVHTLSGQLSALALALSPKGIMKIAQCSFGWRKAALAWLASAMDISLHVKDTSGLHDMIGDESVVVNKTKLAGALHFVVTHCIGLRRLTIINVAPTDSSALAVLSLNSPAALHTLQLAFSDGSVPPSGMLLALARGCPQLKHAMLDGNFDERGLQDYVGCCPEGLESFEVALQNPVSVSLRVLSTLAARCKVLQSFLLTIKGPSARTVWMSPGMVLEATRFRGFVGSFPNLRKLACNVHSLDVEELRYVLERCPRLEELEVAAKNHQLTEIRGVAPSLVKFKSSHLALSNDAVHSLMRTCPSLEHFEVSCIENRVLSNVLSTFNLEVSNLKTLCVTSAGEMTDAALTAVVTVCTRLEELDISHCSAITCIKGPQLIKLQAIRCVRLKRSEGHMDRLETLVLHYCTELESLSSSCQQLKRLDVRYCDKLVSLPTMPNLRTLDLARCCTSKIATEPRWPLLEKLDLHSSDITSATLTAWTAGLARLQQIHLSECQLITDEAIASLSHSCPRLKHLDLWKCFELTAISIDVIKNSFPVLQSLKLVVDSELREAANELCVARPHLQFQERMQLNLVSPDGFEVFCEVKPTTRLIEVMRAYCQRRGVAFEDVRFLFDGNRLRDRQTPFDLDMEDCDTIDVLFAQMNVGEWAQADHQGGALLPISAGDTLLMMTDHVTPAFNSAAAIEIERTATGPSPSRRSPTASYQVFDELLTRHQCEALISHADLHASSAAHDLKMDLTAEQLAAILGSGDVYDALLTAGATQLDASEQRMCGDMPRLVLRRSTTAGAEEPACIRFHRDWCRAVASVALSDQHTGGELVFCIDGRVECPPRPVGSAVAHNRMAVHGVSRISMGVRYNLIAVFGQVDLSSAA